MPVRESVFEIHTAQRLPADTEIEGSLPWDESSRARQSSVLMITESEGIIGLSLNSSGDGWLQAGRADEADLAVRVVRQRLSSYLAVMSLRKGMLVNGVPIVHLAVLTSGDSLVPAPGSLCHVTERVRSYVGPPTDDLLGKKCPFCLLALTSATRIRVCKCGTPYHDETVESHPDMPEEDRLRCFEKVRACLSCGRAVTVEEYLVWDPRSL